MMYYSTLAGLKIGPSHPVRIMGVINISPESFYQGSISDKKHLAYRVKQMEEEGADIIDVGAMSTAPYLKTRILEMEEADRLTWAVRIIRKSTKLPISIDTSRYLPAIAGLTAGADILNDIHGLRSDQRLISLLPSFEGLILMAHPTKHQPSASPISTVKALLKKSIQLALKKISPRKIVLDPGIGFFRDQRMVWWKWDISVLSHLRKLTVLRKPLLVGVSRKSFIGQLLGGQPAEKRLAGSLAATFYAIQNGAHIIRTHDVKETKDIICMQRVLES